MGKMFAVILTIIALVSAYPIVTHKYVQPVDISTHGHAIDEQLADTMAEAGLSFVLAQLLLAFFVWKYSSRKEGSKVFQLPGGAKWVIVAAFIFVGTEVIALSFLGQKAWAEVYFTAPKADALQVQAQGGQFAFYFRYPGVDGKFGPIHPDKIDEGNSNFFGLDPANDVESRDDIISGELAIPVNREVHLLMHSKDVGHSFYVRELRIQQDFVPGLDLSLHFTATQTGRYEILCTQLCGLGHFNMKAYLNVLSQEDFDKWMKQKISEQ
ncbi:MAG TPA: cytochrome C oxidase subunit II [Candidatus Dormibacteraeota bacterium]|nr:cytochrome C oxidase subunit II [Candidatus Dormibacteraeota bacterium]